MRLTTSCESLDLSRNPATVFFSNKAWDRFPIFSKELDATLEQESGETRRSSPGEFCASLLFLEVNAVHGRDVVFQLLQPWDQLFGLLLDIFVLLGGCQSRVEEAGSGLTSQCLTSALTPPRADLRGGNQSDDSFATSKSILMPLTALCTFAVDCWNHRGWGVI